MRRCVINTNGNKLHTKYEPWLVDTIYDLSSTTKKRCSNIQIMFASQFFISHLSCVYVKYQHLTGENLPLGRTPILTKTRTHIGLAIFFALYVFPFNLKDRQNECWDLPTFLESQSVVGTKTSVSCISLKHFFG